MEENQKAWAEPGRPGVLRDINVNVRCSCYGDTKTQLQEILELVKAVKKEVFRQSASAEAAEAAAVHRILEPGTVRLEGVAEPVPAPNPAPEPAS